jgi:hypothetical protein
MKDDVELFINECTLPTGRSFKGWREIFSEDIEIEYGYFYIGHINGYHVWCYLDDCGQLIKHREQSDNTFHFIDQLRDKHKSGFTFL